MLPEIKLTWLSVNFDVLRTSDQEIADAKNDVVFICIQLEEPSKCTCFIARSRAGSAYIWGLARMLGTLPNREEAVGYQLNEPHPIPLS